MSELSANANNADREKAIGKVRVLLAISKDQEGKPEGATAAALAAKMIEKYGLTDKEVGRGLVIDHAGGGLRAAPGIDVWQVVLLAVIAAHYGCDTSGMDVVGPPHTVAWTRAAYDYVADLVVRGHEAHRQDEARKEGDLFGQLLLGSGRLLNSNGYGDPDRARRVRESFGVTAADVLQKRLQREAVMRRRVDQIVAGTLRRVQAELRGEPEPEPEPTGGTALERSSGLAGSIPIPRHTPIPRAEMLIERMVWPPPEIPQ